MVKKTKRNKTKSKNEPVNKNVNIININTDKKNTKTKRKRNYKKPSTNPTNPTNAQPFPYGNQYLPLMRNQPPPVHIINDKNDKSPLIDDNTRQNLLKLIENQNNLLTNTQPNLLLAPIQEQINLLTENSNRQNLMLEQASESVNILNNTARQVVERQKQQKQQQQQQQQQQPKEQPQKQQKQSNTIYTRGNDGKLYNRKGKEIKRPVKGATIIGVPKIEVLDTPQKRDLLLEDKTNYNNNLFEPSDEGQPTPLVRNRYNLRSSTLGDKVKQTDEEYDKLMEELNEIYDT